MGIFSPGKASTPPRAAIPMFVAAFANGREIDNEFEHGRYGWTLGVGFQF